MIIILVLLFFIASSYYAVTIYDSVKNTKFFVHQIYKKAQAYHIFESVLPAVVEALKKDESNVDSLKDIWAYPMVFATEQGQITVTIYDEERYINLNKAGDPEYKQVFERLFRILNIDSSYFNNLLIWIGKKEGNLDLKYPVKKSPLHSKEELLYAGFTRDDLYGKKIGNEFFPGILSLTTVYSSGKININTAPVPVLQALNENIDENLAMKIVERRNKEPFKNINELVSIDGFNFDMIYPIRNIIDVKSQNFHIKLELKSEEVSTTLEVIYDRSNNTIVWKKLI